jgi:hypothetical protein
VYHHERAERKRRFNQAAYDRYPDPAQDPASTAEYLGYLRERKLSAALATRNGWYISTSANDDHLRVVIPAVKSPLYQGTFWQARATDPTVTPRYTSPYAPRDDALVVVWPAKEADSVVLVEGPFDALAVAECGMLGIAIMGVNPTQGTAEHIVRKSSGYNLNICFDSDIKGDVGALYLQTQLALSGRYASVKKIRNTKHKDLAEMPLEERREFLWQK